EGYAPSSPLILDGEGNLFGTTVYGDSSFGTVFKLDAPGNLTTLHSFNADGSEGTYLQTALVLDGAATLYGTPYGGTGSAPAGTIFKLDSSGNLTTLHR